MPIRRNFLLKKNNNNQSRQLSFFGYDNLSFKAINLSNRQRFDNLCNKFKLKKIITNTSLALALPLIFIKK